MENVIKIARKGDVKDKSELIAKLEEMEKRSRSKYKNADLFRKIKEGIQKADLEGLIDYAPQIKK